jgi:hypothetical protein
MDKVSFKKYLLRKIKGENSIDYAIFDPTSGELVFQSQDLAMREMDSGTYSENGTITNNVAYFTILNDELDFIIENEGMVEVKGVYAGNSFQPTFIAQRIIIKWNRP